MCFGRQAGLTGKRDTQRDIFEQHKAQMKIHTDWSGRLKTTQMDMVKTEREFIAAPPSLEELPFSKDYKPKLVGQEKESRVISESDE